jgi:hypothetical protein
MERQRRAGDMVYADRVGWQRVRCGYSMDA